MDIVFDIGGTKTRVAKRIDSNSIGEPLVRPTPKQYTDGFQNLCEMIEEVLSGLQVGAIAGGVAGRWDDTLGGIEEAGNLTEWIGHPLRSDLENRFNVKVSMDNDAAFAGLGEAHFGAGKGIEKFIYMTISTGVGGVRIEYGKIVERMEPRQTIVRGKRLDQWISGEAVEEERGMLPQDIHDDAFWLSQAEILAEGLVIILKERPVEALVLGGSMMNDVGIPVSAVEKCLQNLMSNAPKIIHSTLGDTNGLYGGLATILSHEK